MLYRAKTALYSSTDPNGPEAGRGVISVSPPDWGYQVCGEGAVVSAELVEKLALHRTAYFEPHDGEAAARAADERSKATYETGAYKPVIHGPLPGSVPAETNSPRRPASTRTTSRAGRQMTSGK